LTLLGLLVLSACGPAPSALHALAAAGEVQPDAPLRSKHEVVVQAPRAIVWTALTEAGRWPEWHRAVRSVEAPGALAPDVVFKWNNEGTTVTSRVAVARAAELLAWTGSASVAKAIHVWRLTSNGGATRVTVEETMDGPLLAWLYPQKKLDEAVVAWLADLKVEAERRAGAQ